MLLPKCTAQSHSTHFIGEGYTQPVSRVELGGSFYSDVKFRIIVFPIELRVSNSWATFRESSPFHNGGAIL